MSGSIITVPPWVDGVTLEQMEQRLIELAVDQTCGRVRRSILVHLPLIWPWPLLAAMLDGPQTVLCHWRGRVRGVRRHQPDSAYGPGSYTPMATSRIVKQAGAVVELWWELEPIAPPPMEWVDAVLWEQGVYEQHGISKEMLRVRPAVAPIHFRDTSDDDLL